MHIPNKPRNITLQFGIMKSHFLLIVFLGIALVGRSQKYSDLGIRFNSADMNKIQLEFRKPVAQFSRLRFGLSMGLVYDYPYESIVEANDSLVVMRKKESLGNHYDFRFGLERKLTYDWLSLHADLIFAYSSITYRNNNFYHSPDTFGVWNSYDYNPFTQAEDPIATSVNSVLGGGLSAGLSFNFPLTESFILNFTGNYNGVILFGVAHKETNDVYDEFHDPTGYTGYVYINAGIGLRYVFNSKNRQSEKDK